MIKHIIFDFFGVIADSGKINEVRVRSDILNVPIEKMRKAVMPYRDIINKGDMSIKDFWKHISEDLDIEIKQDPDELFYATLNGIFVYENVLQFVNVLKSRGYTCTLLSDVFESDVTWIKKKGRYDNFDDLIFSCDLGLSKLSDVRNNTHKIFDYALEKYDLNAEEVIFVDDKLTNCEAANRAGIQTIHATSPEYIISETQKILGNNLD